MYLQGLHSEQISAHYEKTIKKNFSTVHKNTARVLSPSCGGMTVKRKRVKGSSVTLKVTHLNVISTFLALNDSISCGCYHRHSGLMFSLCA